MYDASAVTSMMGYGAGPLFWSDKSSKILFLISCIMHAMYVCGCQALVLPLETAGK